MGGLVSAALLAARGCDVTVIDKETHVGGKARQIAVDGKSVDAGPTVFTLRDVFDDIFDECGAVLDAEVALRRAGRTAVLLRSSFDFGNRRLNSVSTRKQTRKTKAQTATIIQIFIPHPPPS